MYKVTSNGIEEQGNVIELTEEDHESILEIFEEASNLSGGMPLVEGRWVNDIAFTMEEAGVND